MYILIDKTTNIGFTSSNDEMKAFDVSKFTMLEVNSYASTFSIYDYCLNDSGELCLKVNDSFKTNLNIITGKIRYRKELEGFVFNGTKISMDREHISLMNASIHFHNLNPEKDVIFKHQSGWTLLTPTEFANLNTKQIEFFYKLLEKEYSIFSQLTSQEVITAEAINSEITNFTNFNTNSIILD